VLFLNRRNYKERKKRVFSVIWQFITRKKNQRQLQLIALLREERYTASELAKHMKISRKTILRYIDEMEQAGYLSKGRIACQYKARYPELYRKVLMRDPRFQLFRQYLWGQASEKISYARFKKLNYHLTRLNLSANRRTGSLLGEPSLIFLLQLRYLRDFYFFEEREIYQQMDYYYRNYPEIIIDKTLFPDEVMINDFIDEFDIQPKFAQFFFFDHLRYHFQLFIDFYQCHREHRTDLYLEVKQACKIIKEVLAWESEVLKITFTVKLFDLFFGIHQGLPLTVFNLKWEQGTVAEIYYRLSKELKREIPVLSNCRIDDLALALKNIVFTSYQVTLTTTPNLDSDFLIQERYEKFISSK